MVLKKESKKAKKEKSKVIKAKIVILAKKLIKNNLTDPEIKIFLNSKFKLSLLESKLIFKTIKKLKREANIKKSMNNKISEEGIDRTYLNKLPKKHKAEYNKLIKKKEKKENQNQIQLLEMRKKLYDYFRKTGHSGGIKNDFFKGSDKLLLIRITHLATEDFETYNDFLRRFSSPSRQDRLEIDQLPKEGLAPGDVNFFEDAKKDYLGIELKKAPRGKSKHRESVLVKAHNDMEKQDPEFEKWQAKNKFNLNLGYMPNINLSDLDKKYLQLSGFEFSKTPMHLYKTVVNGVWFKPNLKIDANESLTHYIKHKHLVYCLPSNCLEEFKLDGSKERIDNVVFFKNRSGKIVEEIAIEFQVSRPHSGYEVYKKKIETIILQKSKCLIVVPQTDKQKYENAMSTVKNLEVINNAELELYLESWLRLAKITK